MPVDSIKGSLKEKGVRLTRQRQLLLELIDKSGEHLDAERLQVAAQAPQRPDWSYPGKGVFDQQRGDIGHCCEVTRMAGKMSSGFSCGGRLAGGP